MPDFDYAEALSLIRKYMRPGDTLGKMFLRAAQALEASNVTQFPQKSDELWLGTVMPNRRRRFCPSRTRAARPTVRCGTCWIARICRAPCWQLRSAILRRSRSDIGSCRISARSSAAPAPRLRPVATNMKVASPVDAARARVGPCPFRSGTECHVTSVPAVSGKLV